jgi:hypothetical protein
MKLDRYQLKAEASLTIFEFISEGPKGKIQKLIQFQETNREGLYNLSFGDKDLSTGSVDDLSISNNKDKEKVLATIVAALYAFFDKYPDAWVYATGSTKARTRLYRMGITKFYPEMVLDFELYGQANQEWQEFEIGKEYDAFLVQRKFL